MKPVLFLDCSRLFRRFAVGGGPTGIDRIEMRYGRWMFQQDVFVPVPVMRFGPRLVALPRAATRRMLAALTDRWQSERPMVPPPNVPADLGAIGSAGLRAAARMRAGRLAARARALDAGGAHSVYVNVGHDGLDQAERYRGLPGAFAALVSDVIPLTHPEFDTPRATELHAKRIRTLVALADHVFAISSTTRDAVARLVPRATFSLSVAHLAGALPAAERVEPDEPTFVHLSSLDRRKNVALLLNVWRELAERAGAGAPGGPHGRVPRLKLIGRSGNDPAVRILLDRCSAIAPYVDNLGALGDQAVARHLSSATALLSPSFVEGFGLPIMEARAIGVPVVASDIAAHREIGGPETLYLSPLDGPGWRTAVQTLSAMGHSARPAAQASALPTWEDHFAAVAPVLADLAR